MTKYLLSAVAFASIAVAGFGYVESKYPECSYLPTLNFRSSFPYITGDTVREACNHILDPTTTFNPLQVQAGDTVFVMIEYLSYFFKELHPQIPCQYILVTHHFFDESDDPVPGNFESYLDDDKLGGWFTHNASFIHPKLHCLPIGIANQFYKWGDVNVFNTHIKEKEKNYPKQQLLYMNFTIRTQPDERTLVYNMFRNKAFCTVRDCTQYAHDNPLSKYLDDLLVHKFVLSPRGHGLDCFRTWESLLMGSYPIVTSSTIDELFSDLPVVIIDSWDEVTPEFLEQKYLEFEVNRNNFNFKKLYMPFWIEQINNLQKEIRKNG